MNVVRDRIARRAAALVRNARELDLQRAIQLAAETLGFTRGAPLPTEAQVRQHLQAMTEEVIGAEGHQQLVGETLAFAAEIMDALERGFAARTLLVGRGARGEFDGGAQLNIRMYSRAELSLVAQLLVDLGCAEPTFETIDSMHGRVNRVRTSQDGVAIVVVRCLPEWWGDRNSDMVTGKPAFTRTLDSLKK